MKDPRFVGEIQVASPNSSDTAYTELTTFFQLFGEDEAYTKLAAISENVKSYTKSGSAPSKAAARGETDVSIGFMHDMINLAAQGFPLVAAAPCEGTGYEVGTVSVIEVARNFEGANAGSNFHSALTFNHAHLKPSSSKCPQPPTPKWRQNRPTSRRSN